MKNILKYFIIMLIALMGFTMTACDDGPQIPKISINDVIVNTEANTTVTFSVTLSVISSETVNVDYATADDTAIAGIDYTGIATTTLIFSPGDLTKTINVSIQDDSIDESDETFLVNLSNPNNATISKGIGTGTIIDNDTMPTISIDNVTIEEADTTAVFTVSLSKAYDQTITVDYSTTNDTAIAGIDYTGIATTTLIFPPGDTTKTINVSIQDDSIDESDETFLVNLSNPNNATISKGIGTGTIIDNDTMPTISIDDVTIVESNTTAVFTVTLSRVSGQTITVDYSTADGTASGGIDYTGIATTTLIFHPGDSTKTIDVSIQDDSIDESNETFLVNLSNPNNVVIADDTGLATIID